MILNNSVIFVGKIENVGDFRLNKSIDKVVSQYLLNNSEVVVWVIDLYKLYSDWVEIESKN